MKVTQRFVGSVVAATLFSSCNPTELKGKLSSSNVVTNSNGALDGRAYVYLESPYILAGSRVSPQTFNISTIVNKKSSAYITPNTQLTSNCTFSIGNGSFQSEISDCMRSLVNQESVIPLARKADRTWIFEPGTPEFYQVNTLYHANQLVETFFDKLQAAYDVFYASSNYGTDIQRSIPPYLLDSGMWWFKAVSSIDSAHYRNGFMNIFSNCKTSDGDAYFSPAGPEICYGADSDHPLFRVVQDPSEVYHELGHAMTSIMMNLRNGTATDSHLFRSTLQNYGYSESHAINEGIADYFAYVMNARTHVGEWGMGTIYGRSRPLSEEDSAHISGLSTTSEGRLSYPQFLLYDANLPDVIQEDEHNGGQIMTHYLVALTRELKSKCFSSSDAQAAHNGATSYVMLLLAESLAEMGDLNAYGFDNYSTGLPIGGTVYFNNLDATNSYLWAHFMNPINYRKMSQVMAKNINKFITGNTYTGAGVCPAYTKNDAEKLLDDYGLLIFKTYNDNGNSTKDRSQNFSTVLPTVQTPTLTPVSENNRRKSVMISKELIKLNDSTTTPSNGVQYYVIDQASNVRNIIAGLLFKGYPLPFSSNASTDYNNGNAAISPGEVVAIAPNLFNNSNNTMAGIQLLATDWDHVDITDTTTGNFKPCQIDNVTKVDAGAEAARSCVTDALATPATQYPDKTYQRLVPDSGGTYPANAAAPVCLVLLENGTSSRWVSQNEFRKKQGLSIRDKDCLGFSASNQVISDYSFNPHECLLRFMPQLNVANYSRIEPQMNYYDSTVKNSDEKIFKTNNLLVMEVNKWVPPGTKFRCRLRARFANCSDCYTDASQSNDDYLDYEYNGPKPFKVLNLDFEVNE